jgi:hypothetical protein
MEDTRAQETLDSYGVQHDQFDFESELGWEGSNDKFLAIMKDSPYFVPQTFKNDQGVPQVRSLSLPLPAVTQSVRIRDFRVGYCHEKVANREIRVWHFVIENGY